MQVVGVAAVVDVGVDAFVDVVVVGGGGGVGDVVVFVDVVVTS